MTNWISTKDKLPGAVYGHNDKYPLVLLYVNGEVTAGYINEFTQSVYYIGNDDEALEESDLYDTTHWATLPAPPTEKIDGMELIRRIKGRHCADCDDCEGKPNKRCAIWQTMQEIKRMGGLRV